MQDKELVTGNKAMDKIGPITYIQDTNVQISIESTVRLKKKQTPGNRVREGRSRKGLLELTLEQRSES
jgi:hypothetical protein